MEFPCPDVYSVLLGIFICAAFQLLPRAAAKTAKLFSRLEESPRSKKQPDTDSIACSELAEPEEEIAPAPLHGFQKEKSTVLSCRMRCCVVVVLLACSLIAIVLHRGPETAPIAGEPLPEIPLGELRTVNLTRQVIPLQRVNGKLRFKSAYWGTLHVGSPRNDFKLVFDSGSGHLILPSSYCYSATCRAHKRFRRSMSDTALDIDHDGTLVKGSAGRDQLTVSFGKGRVDGVFVDDLVCFDNSSLAPDDEHDSTDEEMPAGCMRLRFIAATEMSEDPFASFEFDGILGLGLQTLSQTKEFNFVHVLGGSGVFSIYLADENSQSEITFGGWKAERFRGNRISWNQVVMPEHGHWMLAIKAVYADDVDLGVCNDDCHGIADTGSSLLSVPSVAFNPLFKALLHSPTDANCRGPGPVLRIKLENFEFRLDPRDYARYDQGANETEEAVCKAMLMVMNMPAPIGPKLFIFGEPILRKYYSIFDSNNNRVGFAPSQR